ncbi:MAG: IPT/TIG domain-containing protein [Gammaproteobacteria bacterium]|nr:IPT/TIG domain-containing protein [Gammaproteobacteria bacterium]
MRKSKGRLVSIDEIEGRITGDQQKGSGIPGLLAEIWVSDERGSRKLGSAYTDADGRFVARMSVEAATLRPRSVEIAVIDRYGTLVHRQSLHDLPSDRKKVQPVQVPAATLERHLAEPVLLQPDIQSPVDVHALVSGLESLVRAAFPELDQQRIDELLVPVRCPLPSPYMLQELEHEAFGVLAGDQISIETFLALLDRLGPIPEGGTSPLKLKGCGCGGSLPESGMAHKPYLAKERFLPADKSVAIIAAAAHLQASGRFGEEILSRALFPLCITETIGNLHRFLVGSPDQPTLRRRVGAMLAPFGPFPECPPPRGPSPDLHLTCEPIRVCGFEALEAFSGVPSYLISGVSTAVACPGDVITITGTGFGNVPGRVRFGPVETTATTWTSTSITVTVPTGAGNPLSLVLQKVTLMICGRLIEATPTGTMTATFEIGMPEIEAFFIGSPSNRPYCVEPGALIPLTWRVRGTTRVRVEILDDAGQVVFASDPAPRHGILIQTSAPQTSQTLRLRARLTATGACGQVAVDQFDIYVYRRASAVVNGIEITQAIQYYRANQHLDDATDRGPDNSLRLVTNKAAWVRAYLRSGLDPSFEGGRVPGVDGTLTVERRVNGVWGTVATIRSQNGPVTAVDSFPTYDAERGNINNSLNFVVPAAVMTGLLRFTVNVSFQRTCQSGSASSSIIADVNLQQTLNAAFITISYTGPDATGRNMLNLAAPTLPDCIAETAWAMRAFPLSGQPIVRIAGTLNTTMPLNDPRTAPGACSNNWGALLPRIQALVTADRAANPGNWVYYGIINSGIPVNVPGCNGVATGGLQGQPITYAHEIAHQLGLPHAPCGNAGAANPNYPVYEPYDLPVDVPATPIQNTIWTMASIGEYGLDIDNGNIANPNTAEDFMSYCGPAWISVFSHNFLVNRPNLTPLAIATGSGASSDRVVSDDERGFDVRLNTIRPLIHLLGRVDSEGKVEVTSVARLETLYEFGAGIRSDLRAQLLDEEGRVLAEDTVYRYMSIGCCGEEAELYGGDSSGRGYMLKAMLDDVAPGASLHLLRDGEVVWERQRSEAPPKLSHIKARVDDGLVRLSWTCVRHTDYPSNAWVRWSNNDGKSWHALTIAEGNAVDIPLALLPAGAVRFQIMAHDGFETVTAISAPVKIPALRPMVAILFPRANDRAYAERFLHLRGAAASPGGEPPPAEAYVWYVDGKEIGRGADVWVENPGAGRHKLRLEVSGPGGTGVAQSVVEIIKTSLE